MLRALYDGKEVNENRPTITYCRIGERSARTWFVLHELLGYPKVRNYNEPPQEQIMDATRFDSISKLFATRRTRRAALTGGLAAAALAPVGRLTAQDATPQVATPAVDPNDPHPSADTAQVDPEFLFVQPFANGTWTPKEGEDGVYTLSLSGAAANTVYFSDRPDRIVGLMPNQQFLDGLGFTPDNPPNAAIVATHEGSDEQEVLVIELLNPVYDADAESLTYDAVVLADYGEHGLAHLAAQQQDYELGETFAAGGLFIDSIKACSDIYVTCYKVINGQHHSVGETNIGQCFDINRFPMCNPCNSDGKSSHFGSICAEVYPDQCFAGFDPNFGGYAWNCYVDL